MTEDMSLVVFDPIKATLIVLKKKDESLTFDHTTPEGEKDLRSWVKQLRGYKGDIAKAHKGIKADALAFGRRVDAIKNELTAGADKIIKERLRPLDEMEARKRAAAEAAIKAEADAMLAKEAERIAELKRREAEVAKKEAEIEAKERIEREKRIAEEAAENARKEAERKVEIEAEAKERIRVAEEATARFRQQEADQAEQFRIKNRKHRGEVETLVMTRLCEIIDIPEVAGDVFKAIKAGKIPNVSINY